jgi:hypothetical protein
MGCVYCVKVLICNASKRRGSWRGKRGGFFAVLLSGYVSLLQLILMSANH